MSRIWFVLVLALISLPAAAQGVMLPDAERVELDNGTVLLLVEKRDVPLIGLQAVVRGGAVTDPAGKHGLSDLLTQLLQKGAGDRSAAEFAEAVEAVGGEIDVTAGLESFSVAAEFMAKDAELMVELAADLLRRPALSNTEFAKLRERSINLIKAAKSGDPSNLLPAYANAFLFGEHPYGNPRSGSEASLASISIADIRGHYSGLFGGDRLVVVVVGDFDSALMREQLTQAFGDWGPASAELPAIAAPEKSPGGRVLLVDKPGATQTYFRVGNVGVARDFSQRAELDLANTVFGGRFTSMLMTELRTKSGLSYSARSALMRPNQPGSVFIASFTATGTTVEALDVAIGVLGQLHDAGIGQELLVSARNYIMGQFPPRLETAAQLATQFASLEIAGLDVSYVNHYGASLEAATPESIAAVIDTVYPKSDQLVLVMIGDAEQIRDAIGKYGDVVEMSIDAPQFHPQ